MYIRRWVILAIIAVVALHTPAVFATTSDSDLTVTATVPSSGGSSSQEPQPDPEPEAYPTISTVTTETTTSTAHVSWSASDNDGITAVKFVYGLSTAYGSNGEVVGSYSTTITGLTPETQYFFRIQVTDTATQITTHTGTFTTNAVADVTAPSIDQLTSVAGVNSCSISWATNEITTGEVVYGLTAQYGSATDSTTGESLSHDAVITQLLASTTYHYSVVATDLAGNSAGTNDFLCTTLPDSTPPANPSSIVLTTSTEAISLTWVNPGDADFSGLKVVRTTDGAAADSSSGTLIYSGTGQSVTDETTVSDVVYYYTFFAYDTSGNYSSGSYVSGKRTSAVVNEVCGNSIDDNNNGATDCDDQACSSTPACLPAQEICNNNQDDDGNGAVDCADNQCSGASYCQIPQTEVCDNAIDDDLNGATDCSDVACFAFAACTTTIPGSTDEGSTYVPPETTVPEFAQIGFDQISFLGGNRTFTLTKRGVAVRALAGSSVSVAISESALPTPAERITLKVNGSGEFQFALVGNMYYADVVWPRIGTHQSFVEIHYGSDQNDVITFNAESSGYGIVRSDSITIEGAKVTLLDENDKVVTLTTPNPITTNSNGTYGWLVPNGKYRVQVEQAGYYTRTTPLVKVENNIVNTDITLVVRPPELFDNVSTTSTLVQNASTIAQNVVAKTKAVAEQSVEKVKDAVKAVEEIKKSPEAQKTASQVVAPATVSVVAVGTVGFVSWANLMPFLRLLFLQPLMLLGHGRRKGWGQVYNTLNKLPVDLATVRLIQADTGKLLQSKVTDKEGRYAFVVNPGTYIIQVMKAGFSFPTTLLATAKQDGRRHDIYHGEPIKVTEQEAVITANIPLDPAGEVKKPVRIFWQRIGRTAQLGVSWFGLLVTVASLYIAPRWYVWVLLAIHVSLFLIFRRLAIPAKIKSWGIVYDATTKHPVGRTVARLFNSEYDKLVATQITDGSGRYYFLAGDDTYYVTYDHPDYSTEKTTVLDLSGKDAANITVDVGLNKHQGQKIPTSPVKPVKTETQVPNKVPQKD